VDYDLNVDKIAQICFDFYDKNLSNMNRLSNKEWTNLAAILVIDKNIAKYDNQIKVLSMATGSKCLSEKLMPLNGSMILDSHAEILARRCFIR
jgi:hypothetical protein